VKLKSKIAIPGTSHQPASAQSTTAFSAFNVAERKTVSRPRKFVDGELSQELEPAQTKDSAK